MKSIPRLGWTVLGLSILCGTMLAQPADGQRGGPPAGRGRRGGPPPSGLEQAMTNLNVTGPKRQEVVAAVRAYESNVRALTELAGAELVLKLKEVVSATDYQKLRESAQRAAPRGNTPAVTEDDLVTRVLAFDKSGEGRVTKDDLPERMQSLVDQGDLNHDSVLDRDELKNLATDRPTAAAGRRGGGGGAGANAGGLAGSANGVSFASIEGAVAALSLTAPVRETAAGLVRSERDTVARLTALARSDLLLRASSVLSDDEFSNFTAVLDRQTQLANSPAPRRAGPPPIAPPRGTGRGPRGNRAG